MIRQANAGKPAALNTGIAAARHDILVLVDGDTVFEPDALRALVAPFADPDVGAVSGNTKVGNREGLLGRWQHIEYVIGFNLDRRMFDVLRCMPTVPGAIGAFRRRTLDGVGGVSERHAGRGHRPHHGDLPRRLAGRLRAGGPRLDRGAGRPGTAVAPALPVVLRHDAGDVEAPPVRGRGRRLGQARTPGPAVPAGVPGAAAAARPGDRRRRAVLAVVFTGSRTIALVWLGFLALQYVSAVYAFVLDKERLGPLWSLALQQFVYRQLMYLVVIQSVASAVYGIRLRWQTIRRTGDLDAAPVTTAGRV